MPVLTTSFQARAATRPKPEVERVMVCLMMAAGSCQAEAGGRKGDGLFDDGGGELLAGFGRVDFWGHTFLVIVFRF